MENINQEIIEVAELNALHELGLPAGYLYTDGNFPNLRVFIGRKGQGATDEDMFDFLKLVNKKIMQAIAGDEND